jgi:hypothetical protein
MYFISSLLEEQSHSGNKESRVILVIGQKAQVAHTATLYLPGSSVRRPLRDLACIKILSEKPAVPQLLRKDLYKTCRDSESSVSFLQFSISGQISCTATSEDPTKSSLQLKAWSGVEWSACEHELSSNTPWNNEGTASEKACS